MLTPEHRPTWVDTLVKSVGVLLLVIIVAVVVLFAWLGSLPPGTFAF